MEIKSNVEIYEVYDLQKDLIKHSKYHKNSRRIQFVVGLIVIVVLSNTLYELTLGNTAILLVLTILIFPTLYNEVNMMKAKGVIQKQDLSSWIGEQKLIINHEGIIKENESSKRNYKWENFVIAREDKRNYYIYISDTQGISINKNSLKNREDEFKVYYDKYIKNLPKK